MPAMNCLCSVLILRVTFPDSHIQLSTRQQCSCAPFQQRLCLPGVCTVLAVMRLCLHWGFTHHHGRKHPTSPRPHTGTSQHVGPCSAEETQPSWGPPPLIQGENPMAHRHAPCKAATSPLISQPCSSRENCK